jgi:Clp amino terminal domain, pathogenicity island component
MGGVMTIDDRGIAGFEYTDQRNENEVGPSNEAQTAQGPSAQGPSSTEGKLESVGGDSQSQPAADEPRTYQMNGDGVQPNEGTEEVVTAEVVTEFERNQIAGLEPSASDCFNRANQIARSLNHTNLSTDHLMLALTMDQSARRLLERVADVAKLREIAMQRLGKNYTRSSRDVSEQPLPPTSDLADLGKAARAAAAEREQLIAISDLISAFPKRDGRLTYGSDENSRASAVIESIEKGLVPRVDDALTRIEAAIHDAMQRQHQSVHALLQDLSAGQIEKAEQRQREFMEDVRRQVLEAASAQLTSVLNDFEDRIDAKLAELAREPARTIPPGNTAKPRGAWSWLTLF